MAGRSVVRTILRLSVAATLCVGFVQTAVAQHVAVVEPPRDTREPTVVSVDVNAAMLGSVIHTIARQAGLVPAYDETVLPIERRVTLHLKNVSAEAAFEAALQGTGLVAQVQATGAVTIMRGTVARKLAGDLAGRVTASKTTRGLRGVNVVIDDSLKSVRTDDDGRYHFSGIAAGAHRVTVRYVGFTRKSQVATVVDDQTTIVDFVLESSVNMLDQVVVTATGPQRYRELGHVVEVINADSLVRVSPIMNMADLLTARIPGLQVITSGGTVGGDIALRLRGQTTSRLDPQPIVIVDGVRYKSNNLIQDNSGAVVEDTRPAFAESRSPLNDLNVNDIETVEVVKGPSATTLYGPDAANGVIVVTTKRGKVGKPEWQVYVHPSIHSAVPTDRTSGLTVYQAWGHDPTTLALFEGNCTLAYQGRQRCILDSVTVEPQQVEEAGVVALSSSRPQGVFGGSVRGGTPGLQYFVSGSYDTEDGVLTLPSRALQAYRQVHGASALPEALSKPNTQQAIDVHSSLSTDFGAKGNLAVTTTYNQSTQRAVSVFFYANGLAYGLPPAGVDTAQYYQGLGASLEQSSVNSSQAQTRRLSGNASGTYRPNAWLTGNASLGTDLGNSTDVSVRPVGTTDQYDQGQASDYRRNNVGRTGNVGLTAIAKPGNLSYQSSLGVQYVYAHTDGLNADGSNLAPGSSSITTATYLVDSQIWSESVQLGTYGEEVIGFHDLLFLTGSLRIDGSTSYGDAYKPRPYPKVGLSWIASDEPFLHGLPGLDELRFRYSFGAASRAPTSLMKLGQIQSVQRTIEGQTQNEYQRVGLANPNIRPERTQESEYGMDATLFSGFLQARLTGYSRRTNDQINTINEPNGLPFQQG